MTIPTPGVHIHPQTGKKTFVPLENNPRVFTNLIHALGISPKLGFFDIYSITDPPLLELVPRPVHALIFIAPADVYYRLHSEGAPKELTYSGNGEVEPVWWCKQTIGHSCGLMALVHSVANGSARQFVQEGSLMKRLLDEGTPLAPLPRAAVLYDSLELEIAHMDAAKMGDSQAPSSAEPNGYHFLAFVKGKDGHLWELDGGWDGPIDHGLLSEGQDMLSSEAIGLGVAKYLELAQGCIEYSMVALATRPDAEV